MNLPKLHREGMKGKGNSSLMSIVYRHILSHRQWGLGIFGSDLTIFG